MLENIPFRVKIICRQLNIIIVVRLPLTGTGTIMRKFSMLSLRSQIILLVIIMSLLPIALIFYTTIRQQQYDTEEALHIISNLVDEVGNDQRVLLTGAEQLLSSLTHIPAVQQRDVPAVNRLLTELSRKNPQLSNLLMADRTGRIWASTQPGKTAVNIADRRYFQHAMASGKFAAGEFTISRIIDQPVISFGLPIRDASGTITDIAAASFTLSKYKELLNIKSIPEKTSLLIADHKGSILFAYPSAEHIGKQDRTDLFQRMAEKREAGSFEEVGITGIRRYFAFKQIRMEGEQTPYMYIRAGIAKDEVLGSTRKTLLINVASMVAVLLLALLLAAYVCKRGIMDKIAALREATQRIASGEQHIQVSDYVSGGELGELGAAFDKMARQLEEDAGKREQGEKALRESEERFRSLMESIPSVAVQGYYLDGTVHFWNRASELLYGYSEQEALGGNLLDLIIPPEMRSGVQEAIRQMKESGEEIPAGELLLCRKDGSRVPVFSSHALIRPVGRQEEMFCLDIDLTERRQVEDALHKSEAHYRSIFDNSLIGVAITDPELVIIDVNNAFCKLLGYGKEELIGKKNLTALSHEDDVAQSLAMVNRLRSREIDHYCLEKRYLAKNGAVIDALVYVRGMYNQKGEYEGATGTVLDISQRKRVEEERLSLERQMLHAQKMESLGVLAGGIAHDFNNILTSIVGNTDLALMRLNPESPAIENIKRIETSAVRATDLARQMLAYSGKGKFVVESIDLNRLIEEMGHMLEVSISKKALLRFDLARHLPSVEVDATQIRQIVMNLVINASEALGEHPGTIAVSTGCLRCDRKDLQTNWLNADIDEGNYVYLEVADTGCGMDKETQAKLFDPFFTTKFTGRGLGMAAVQGIVRGHKGAINVYSEPGQGSTFKILLPASAKPIELPAGAAGEMTFRGEGTVLLVDDEATVLDIGREMLQEIGYQVVTAFDGREALAVFQEHAGLSCVILDLTMPHLDGEQAFQELRKLDPYVKVIISSGFSEYEVTRKFAGMGLSGFIQKPYKMSALRDVLAGIGD
jgi:PAS domain S-box-containing protein